MPDKTIAVLIPCYNEAQTIGQVVQAFKHECPDADVYVYDNNSTDATIAVALQHGARVHQEPKQGKGFVVRRMFSEVNADYYIMVDGDGTYDAKSIRKMLHHCQHYNLDMLVATRQAVAEKSYPLGHRFGNRLFNRIVAFLFGKQFTDIFSGYRVFSKKFVKSFPCFSAGFEIETEMSVHALEMNLTVGEYPTPYYERPAGSTSKLSTIKDGFKILFMILKLLKHVRPMFFFSLVFLVFSLASMSLFYPILVEYLATGLVPRLPTTILVASLMLCGVFSLFSGLILESVAHARRQNNWLSYLSQKPDP